MNNNIEELRKIYSEEKFASYVGIQLDEVDDNYAKCSLKLQEHHYSRGNDIMGGVIFSLADFAFTVVANHDEMVTVTSTSKIYFLSGTDSKTIYAEAVATKKGVANGFYEVTVTDDKGKQIAFIEFTGATRKPYLN